MGAESVLVTSPFISSRQAKAVPEWWTSASIVLVDVLALSIVYWCAVIVRRLITPGDIRFYLQIFPGVMFFVLAFATHGLYPGVLLHPAEEIRRVFHCVSVVFLLVLCTTFLWHNAESYSRSIVMVIWALGAPAVLVARKLGRHFLSRCDWWGVSAVVFASGASLSRLLNALSDREVGVRVTAVISDDFQQSACRTTAHYAILAHPPRLHATFHDIIRNRCKGFSHILLLPDIHGLCSLGISARDIGGEIGFDFPQRLFHKRAASAKRWLDIVLSSCGLAFLSPLFLLIALLIKLTSKGPVFYGHIRYGRDGRLFKALKFRTMYQNAESILIQHFQQYPNELSSWQRDHKLKKDPRVTAVGRWLRRCSLDELPQLLNVLFGEMSLVGPRPIVSAEIQKYGPGYDLYSRVRPGITGLWQVSGRNNTTYPERVAFDEYYVRNWSIWLDTYILARTIKAVLTADGAY